MARNIAGKKVAILTENGFEEVELTSPKKVLEEVLAHKLQYPELFTSESNKRIVDTAYAIVNAASGTNKS